MFQKNCICSISSRSKKRQKLIAFIFLNTIQYPRTLKNNIYHSKNKWVPPPFFSFGYQSCVWLCSDPFFWQNPCSGSKIEIGLIVVLEYTSFNFVPTPNKFLLARFGRSYVKRPAVILTSHTSYTAFLLDVCCAVQSGHIPYFAAVCPQ